MPKNILCMTALAAIVAPASAAEWMTDFEAAKAKAAKENKALLVDFTGSDWCGYCIKLRKEVLDTPAFEKYTADKFVLMEVDMPNIKQLAPELKEQNTNLCTEYNIQGFPTVLVMTPEGKVAGGFSGFRPDMAAVKAPLDTALGTVELLKKADAAEGDAKAKILKEAYDSIPEDMRESTGLLDAITAADTNNVTGIQDVVRDKKQAEEIRERLSALPEDPEQILAAIDKEMETATPNNKKKLEEARESVRNMMFMEKLEKAFKESPAKAIALVDELLPSATGERKLTLLGNKFQIQMMAAETPADLEAAKATAQQLMELLPEDEKAELADIIKEEFADPAALLEQIKEQREAMNAEDDEDDGDEEEEPAQKD